MCDAHSPLLLMTIYLSRLPSLAFIIPPPFPLSHLKAPEGPFDLVSRPAMPLYMLTWCMQFGPDGDTKITRVGKGKVQVHGSLDVKDTLSADDIIIDGVPLHQYIQKIIQAAMGK